MSMNAYRNYSTNTSALSKNLEKLSSGYKINRASDDAAGLAISEKMRAQISGLKQASNNVKDGISLVKTAEGALQEVQDMLNRMVTLATQSANGTYDDSVDRAALQDEFTALNSEIDRIADSANFNGIKLLNGAMGGGVTATVTTVGAAGGDYDDVNNQPGAYGQQTIVDLDFSGQVGNFTPGATVTVDDGTATKIFEFVANAGDAVKTTGATAVTLGADKDASLNALLRAIGWSRGNIQSAGYSGGRFWIESEWPKGGQNPGDKGDPAVVFKISSSGIGGSTLKLQIGDTADSYNQIDVSIDDMHTSTLGINSIDLGTQSAAADAITTIKTAINSVSSTRGDLGAIQNRLEHTANNLSVMTENIQDAESTIRDTDIADEMTAYTKNNILIQCAQAMLAQANTVPQGVLQMLQ
jgi:flagellin